MAGNLEATQRLFAIWNTREFEDLIPLVSHDLEWVPATMSAVEGGSYHGVDGLREFFEEWDHTWRVWEVDVDEIEESGNQVLTLGQVHAEARGSGMELDQEAAYLFEFDEDGLLIRGSTFFSHDQARAAARGEHSDNEGGPA